MTAQEVNDAADGVARCSISAPDVDAAFLCHHYGESTGIDRDLFSALFTDGGFISGSLLLHALLRAQGKTLKWDVGDVDIFLFNPSPNVHKWMHDKCDNMFKTRHPNPFYKFAFPTCGRIHAIHEGRHKKSSIGYQLIYLDRYKLNITEPYSSEKVMQDFDLDVCGNWFNGMGKVMSLHPESIDAMRIKINPAKLKEYWIEQNEYTSIVHHRVDKYFHRGFDFDPEQIQTLLDMRLARRCDWWRKRLTLIQECHDLSYAAAEEKQSETKSNSAEFGQRFGSHVVQQSHAVHQAE